jgi:hypothetical protein
LRWGGSDVAGEPPPPPSHLSETNFLLSPANIDYRFGGSGSGGEGIRDLSPPPGGGGGGAGGVP